ncbi:Ig-like domain-containing protein [bacterium]|nr:Ig-like domain-containing protein [bacterium]
MARAAEPARAKAEEFDPALPPQVVATEPADRATDVPATLREIKVTFDRPMTTGQSYSWIIHQNLGVYPGYRGGPPPRWENGGRTCVLPVLLSPGALYAVGTNSYRHTGFRDRKGKVAVPRAFVFKTKMAQEL